MRVVMFYHSFLSDWNHGNAHFLRGIARELVARGHDVTVFEPRDGWSIQQLIAEHGEAPLRRIQRAYRGVRVVRYTRDSLHLDRALDGADLVLVHEWNDPALVRTLGKQRARMGSFRLLFHDTHHRSVTAPDQMATYDLSRYDGVLAFGEVIRRLYLKHRWCQRAWTWHEAADVAHFRPQHPTRSSGDLVWIGNWGDDERTRELHEFLIEPVGALRLKACVHGVRYPDPARQLLAHRRIEYAGWLPNQDVPAVFSRYRLTLHVPRRPYMRQLPGIPTIRVFEALACGIPLLCAPWRDTEGLFTPGKDYLVARTGNSMRRTIAELLHEPDRARQLAAHGHRTILRRHTCRQRVNELLRIYREVAA